MTLDDAAARRANDAAGDWVVHRGSSVDDPHRTIPVTASSGGAAKSSVAVLLAGDDKITDTDLRQLKTG